MPSHHDTPEQARLADARERGRHLAQVTTPIVEGLEKAGLALG